jgi:predicted nucleic acid-binding protein
VIVIDTNVLSEIMRPQPEPAVVNWLRSHDERDLYTTSISVAEILYGLERLPSGRRRQQLATAARRLFEAFAEQVLPFDASAASEYAVIAHARERAGTFISGFDAQIAAICRIHRATLATRNVGDFEATGVDVVSPWSPSET